uniref:PLOD1-3-like GT domain-containing protein n=1 Tax=Romanomermis culicivorax TaxID=13658 RepID=A0A915KFH2_ROMCU
MYLRHFILFNFSIILSLIFSFNCEKNGLLLVTVATEKTDGFERFMKSAEKFNVKVKVLGLNEEWKGGDMDHPGGGHKIILLRNALEEIYKHDPDSIVLFTDSYDVIINGYSTEILKRFRKSEARILFSAEKFCWPEHTLAVKYPIVKSGKRYLNSGMFIGYVVDLQKLLSYDPKVDFGDDDQLYYTKAFLDESLRNRLNIKLDHLSTLFQNLNGVNEEVDIFMADPDNDGYPSLRNLAYSTNPLIIHGNGPTKVFLNYLGRYLGKAWKNSLGCIDCLDMTQKFSQAQPEKLPIITLALFVEKLTPFLNQFFEKIVELNYPKSKIHLFLHNKELFHDPDVDNFLKQVSNEYASVKIYRSFDEVLERNARNKAVDLSYQTDSKFVFVVDSDVFLTDKHVITKMMDRNKAIIAPMIPKSGKLFSNFWGDLDSNGFYARSDDYVAIVEYGRKGIWNVPYIGGSYLIDLTKLKSLDSPYAYESQFDPDMSFTKYFLKKGIFMFVDNLENYGALIDTDYFDSTVKHPNFYQLLYNPKEWEREYLHENYTSIVDKTTTIIQPCPDVFWFPIFNEKFCHHLIDIMENFGKWSSGTNQDERLAGGYENVPTRDIHMNQVGLEGHWLYMLDKYFRPVQEKVFEGYQHS